MKPKLTGTFHAHDSQNNLVRVYKYTEMKAAITFGDPNAVEEGLSFLKTEDGEHCNDLGNGRFEIVSSGEILTVEKSE